MRKRNELATTKTLPRRIRGAGSFWAGLLASGSSYSLHLPASYDAVAFADFVPGYSGGTATEFHRFPYSSRSQQAKRDTQNKIDVTANEEYVKRVEDSEIVKLDFC